MTGHTEGLPEAATKAAASLDPSGLRREVGGRDRGETGEVDNGLTMLELAMVARAGTGDAAGAGAGGLSTVPDEEETEDREKDGDEVVVARPARGQHQEESVGRGQQLQEEESVEALEEEALLQEARSTAEHAQANKGRRLQARPSAYSSNLLLEAKSFHLSLSLGLIYGVYICCPG